MSDPVTRALRMQNLRDALDAHGLTEEPGPRIEHASMTPVIGDLGAIDVIELTEDGARTYRGWILTDDEGGDE